MALAKIPVVDFSKEDCLKPGTSSWLSASNEVCHALEELGCFMAVLPNYKVPMELHNTLFGTLNDLFDFPIEIKRQTPYEKPLGDGYVPGRSSQSLSIGRNTEETRKLIHHFWPEGNDSFRESVDGYAKVMAELDQVVTRMVFENYGVEQYHDDHVQSTISSLRFSKYNESKKTGNVAGLPSHLDKTFTTILSQNHVNGLEVNTKEDEWIGFDPLPSSFLVLAGDAFQVWSNDRIRSCKHRVTLRENEVRYSLGLFSFNQGVTNIPIELTDKDHPIQYKPLHQLEYLQYFQANYSSIGLDYSVKKYCGV